MSSSGERSSTNSRVFVTKPPCISASESTLLPVPEAAELPTLKQQMEDEDEDSDEFTSSVGSSVPTQLPYDGSPYPFFQEIVRITENLGYRGGASEFEELVQEIYDSDHSKTSDSSSEECVYSHRTSEDDVGRREEGKLQCNYSDLKDGEADMSCITIKSSNLLSAENNESLLETLCRDSTSMFCSDFSSLSSIRIDYDYNRDQKHFLSIQKALRTIIKKCLEAKDPSVEIDKYVPYIIMRLTSKVAEGLRGSNPGGETNRGRSHASLDKQQTQAITHSISKPLRDPFSRPLENKQCISRTASTQTKPLEMGQVRRGNTPTTIKERPPSARHPTTAVPTFIKKDRNDVRKEVGRETPSRLPRVVPTRHPLRKQGPALLEERNDNMSQNKRSISPNVQQSSRPPWKFYTTTNPVRNQERQPRPAVVFQSPERSKQPTSPERARDIRINQMRSPIREPNASPNRRLPSRLLNRTAMGSPSRVPTIEKDVESTQVIHPPLNSSVFIRNMEPCNEYKEIVRPASPRNERKTYLSTAAVRSPEREKVIRQSGNESRTPNKNRKCLPSANGSNNTNGQKNLRRTSQFEKPLNRNPYSRSKDIEPQLLKRGDGMSRSFFQESRRVKQEFSTEPLGETQCRVAQASPLYSQSTWNTIPTDFHKSKSQPKCPVEDYISRENNSNQADQEINDGNEGEAPHKPSVPTILIVTGDFISRKKELTRTKRFERHNVVGDNLYNTYNGYY